MEEDLDRHYRAENQDPLQSVGEPLSYATL